VYQSQLSGKSSILSHLLLSPPVKQWGTHPWWPPLCTFKVKVKESHNRSGVAQRVPGGLGFQISWHSAHEGGEIVSLTHRPPLPPEMFLVLFFTRGWVDPRAMVWPEGNMSPKNPVTPPGIDPGAVRLVAQRLNHYATPGPCALSRIHSFIHSFMHPFIPKFLPLYLKLHYQRTFCLIYYLRCRQQDPKNKHSIHYILPNFMTIHHTKYSSEQNLRTAEQHWVTKMFQWSLMPPFPWSVPKCRFGPRGR
jgi:hypothetical protein